MRMLMERDYNGWLWRVFMGRWSEVAYVRFGLSGLCFDIEFPSDWHERPLGWIRIGLGAVRIGLSFPWPWTVPDEMQCSGPTYGFTFFGDGLHLHWGKCKGRRTDPMTIIDMPWAWRHREHKVLTEPVDHSYRYVLHDGTVQNRIATIKSETRRWTRPWIPYKQVSRSIDVNFNEEVGERSGSWKGGVMGCSYEMLPHEQAIDTLRRMERERKFT